jgi:tetratricopeptide (TPR) repeat protein
MKGLPLILVGCGSLCALEDAARLFREAQEAHARQDLALAASLYEKVVQLDPALAEAHSNLGLAYYMQARYEDALASFRRALERKPDLFVPLLFSGVAHARMRRHSRAIPLLEHALKQRPGDPQALMYLGLSHASSGRRERAQGYFERLVDAAPSDPEAFYQLGRNYLALSVDSYARVQALDPEGFLHKRILARIDEGQNKPLPEIERRWREIVAARPGYPGMHRQLASVLERAGKSSEAAGELKKERELPAVRLPNTPEALKPGDDEALEKWTRGALQTGGARRARDAVRALAGKYPDWPMPHFLLGEVWLQLSLDAHKKLYEVDPAGYRTLLLEGEAREAADDNDGALKAHRAAIQAAPGAPEVHYRLGLLLIKLNQYEGAVSEFARELEGDAFHVAARLRLGETLLFLERNAEAIQALERAVRDDPELELAYVVLARAYLADERFDPAASALEKAIALDPSDRQAHYLLARVYQRQGRSAEAKRELEIFQKLEKTKK